MKLKAVHARAQEAWLWVLLTRTGRLRGIHHSVEKIDRCRTPANRWSLDAVTW